MAYEWVELLLIPEESRASKSHRLDKMFYGSNVFFVGVK